MNIDGGLDDDPALDQRLVDAKPDADEITRAVWHARVAAALFGDAAPVTVGRYQLIRQLGQGGGGSVFAAIDPELHREIAVKLIRSGSERHRERALAEARALAKLSHPNVVPVHDVGATETHVYVVMELLRGESLREFAGPSRTVREIVAAYRQAAAGLAAAHAVGLVHRDFKPDNAMFGDDGRLRVVDFGLATDPDSADGKLVGTPRYMAPEQRAGGRIDAAVDQYALGIALREAVTDHGRSEPAWLGRVLSRATADEPAARYPSMQALAQALALDPRTRWKRRALIGAPIALAIAGFGLGRSATTERAEVCAGGPDTLAPVWTRQRVDEVVAQIERSATPFAVAAAPLLRERLGELGNAWLTAHRKACTAHERGELSHELYDRSMVCLARARIGLGQTMELLAATGAEHRESDRTAIDKQLDQAITALSVAERPDRCADPIVLASEANPQPTPAMRAVDEQIETAAIHARAATSTAIPLARRAVAAARAIEDQRLLARALLVLGHAAMSFERDKAAEPLHEAMLLGVATGQDAVATEAYARHAYVLANQQSETQRQSPDGLELARALGQRAGDRGAFARALLSNNVGAIAMLGNDFAAARTDFQRAVDEARDVTGPGAVELVTALSNLALVTTDPAERQRLHATAVARVDAAVGPDHPQSFDKRLRAISDSADAKAVVDGLTDLCGRLVALHPTLHALIDVCAFELAWQATALGLPSVVRQAARIPPADESQATWLRKLVVAYAALADAAAPKAMLDELAQLAALRAAEVQGSWYANRAAADAELALAAAARAAGDHDHAARSATRAIRYLEAYVAITGVSAGAIERRLRWARELQGASTLNPGRFERR